METCTNRNMVSDLIKENLFTIVVGKFYYKNSVFLSF